MDSSSQFEKFGHTIAFVLVQTDNRHKIIALGVHGLCQHFSGEAFNAYLALLLFSDASGVVVHEYERPVSSSSFLLLSMK